MKYSSDAALMCCAAVIWGWGGVNKKTNYGNGFDWKILSVKNTLICGSTTSVSVPGGFVW